MTSTGNRKSVFAKIPAGQHTQLVREARRNDITIAKQVEQYIRAGIKSDQLERREQAQKKKALR